MPPKNTIREIKPKLDPDIPQREQLLGPVPPVELLEGPQAGLEAPPRAEPKSAAGYADNPSHPNYLLFKEHPPTSNLEVFLRYLDSVKPDKKWDLGKITHDDIAGFLNSPGKGVNPRNNKAKGTYAAALRKYIRTHLSNSPAASLVESDPTIIACIKNKFLKDPSERSQSETDRKPDLQTLSAGEGLDSDSKEKLFPPEGPDNTPKKRHHKTDQEIEQQRLDQKQAFMTLKETFELTGSIPADDLLNGFKVGVIERHKLALGSFDRYLRGLGVTFQDKNIVDELLTEIRKEGGSDIKDSSSWDIRKIYQPRSNNKGRDVKYEIAPSSIKGLAHGWAGVYVLNSVPKAIADRLESCGLADATPQRFKDWRDNLKETKKTYIALILPNYKRAEKYLKPYILSSMIDQSLSRGQDIEGIEIAAASSDEDIERPIEGKIFRSYNKVTRHSKYEFIPDVASGGNSRPIRTEELQDAYGSARKDAILVDDGEKIRKEFLYAYRQGSNINIDLDKHNSQQEQPLAEKLEKDESQEITPPQADISGESSLPDSMDFEQAHRRGMHESEQRYGSAEGEIPGRAYIRGRHEQRNLKGRFLSDAGYSYKDSAQKMEKISQFLLDNSGQKMKDEKGDYISAVWKGSEIKLLEIKGQSASIASGEMPAPSDVSSTLWGSSRQREGASMHGALPPSGGFSSVTSQGIGPSSVSPSASSASARKREAALVQEEGDMSDGRLRRRKKMPSIDPVLSRSVGLSSTRVDGSDIASESDLAASDLAKNERARSTGLSQGMRSMGNDPDAPFVLGTFAVEIRRFAVMGASAVADDQGAFETKHSQFLQSTVIIDPDAANQALEDLRRTGAKKPWLYLTMVMEGVNSRKDDPANQNDPQLHDKISEKYQDRYKTLEALEVGAESPKKEEDVVMIEARSPCFSESPLSSPIWSLPPIEWPALTGVPSPEVPQSPTLMPTISDRSTRLSISPLPSGSSGQLTPIALLPREGTPPLLADISGLTTPTSASRMSHSPRSK